MDKVVYFAGHHQHYGIMPPNLIMKGHYKEPLYLPVIDVILDRAKLRALVDTGANMCFISDRAFTHCNLVKNGVSEAFLPEIGLREKDTCQSDIIIPELNNQQFTISFAIDKMNPGYDLVLGTYFLNHFKFTLNGKLQTFELEYLTRL